MTLDARSSEPPEHARATENALLNQRAVRAVQRWWQTIRSDPPRVFVLSLLALFALRSLFAVASVQYHLDGDNTVSLLQANDWFATPQRSYFWGQNYMGTTEVWVFSSLWRLFFGAHASIPLLYWVCCAQLMFALGSALVMAGLVYTDRSFWGRPGVFALSAAVIGFGIPVFQKYSFGVGHGYSAGPMYAGITIACYLFRERISVPLFLVAGLLLGQSHYIFRLHILFPVALLGSLVVAGPRRYALKSAALGVGTLLGMLPEKLLEPAQGNAPTICLSQPLHVLQNAWLTLTQLGTHAGTLAYSLVESEHAVWFAGHRPIAETCIAWGEWVGAGLFSVLLVIELVRAVRSPKYLIFSAIVLVNFASLAASCLDLDVYTARRYMHPAIFAVAFLLLSPPWTLVHRAAIALRCATFAVYAVSALSFHTPLADFAVQSKQIHFNRKLDCVIGTGGDLTALIALNGLHNVRTIDLDWRLRSNYSHNVASTRGAIGNNCRQVVWLDSRGGSDERIRKLCKLEDPFYEAVPQGIVEYPQHVRFRRCRVRGHALP